MNILVVVEQRGCQIKKSTYESLTLAAELSQGGTCTAAIIGKGVSALASELAGWGVAKVYAVEGEGLESYNPMNYSAALAKVIDTVKPNLVITGATPLGRDLSARTAAKTSAPLVTDVTHLARKDAAIVVKKPLFSGKALVELKLNCSKLAFVSVRPNIITAKKVGTGEAAVEKMNSDVVSSTLVTKELRKGASTKADLTEATVIVSGGRSLGSAENFAVLAPLADVLSATVGASRAAVDAGYASHEMQVGQTGKTVNPNLYIACGISGAIQHLAGMRTSKVIVAINKDKEAPIFKVADFGIVGDLFEVVPALTTALKKIM